MSDVSLNERKLSNISKVNLLSSDEQAVRHHHHCIQCINIHLLEIFHKERKLTRVS